MRTSENDVLPYMRMDKLGRKALAPTSCQPRTIDSGRRYLHSSDNGTNSMLFDVMFLRFKRSVCLQHTGFIAEVREVFNPVPLLMPVFPPANCFLKAISLAMLLPFCFANFDLSLASNRLRSISDIKFVSCCATYIINQPMSARRVLCMPRT